MSQIHREGVKDKRTLVLFVLGLLLLIVDFRSISDRDIEQFDGIIWEKMAHQWRLTSDSAAVVDGPRQHQHCILVDNTPALSFTCPQGVTVHDIPAELYLFFNKPLPINRADQRTLEMLPGVGPHLAATISATLQRTGKFTGPDDLLKVPGIGPKSLKRLLPLISFE